MQVADERSILALPRPNDTLLHLVRAIGVNSILRHCSILPTLLLVLVLALALVLALTLLT